MDVLLCPFISIYKKRDLSRGLFLHWRLAVCEGLVISLTFDVQYPERPPVEAGGAASA